jgi:hypothetical protein
MSERNFFAELKRRNVYKVAVSYVIVAWLLIQVATQTFPFFEIPNWAVRLVIILLTVSHSGQRSQPFVSHSGPSAIRRAIRASHSGQSLIL